MGFEAAATVTGVGAAKTATKGAVEAAENAAARAAPEVRAVSGTAAEVENIGENASKITEKLDDLADDVPTGVLPGSNGPTIPPSLTEPKAPVAPHIPDSPTPRAAAPHEPTWTTVDAPPHNEAPRSGVHDGHSTAPHSGDSHGPAPGSSHRTDQTGAADHPATDTPDHSAGTANQHPTPPSAPVPGVDYPLPPSDALQILQDPAAEVARLGDGNVPPSILEGYDPLAGRSLEDFQHEFAIRDSDGKLQWDWDNQAPNNGFAGDPIETDSIPDGQPLDRLGSDGGGFIADEGAPMADRAMAPGAAAQYHTYEGTGVAVPDDENWVVQHGPAKPAYGQPGGANQWVVIDLDTNKPVPVIELLRAGMLR